MTNAACAAIGERPRRPLKRPTEELSWELANHVKSYLEAGQYHNGYTFLCSLLNAATSISVPAKPYVGFLAPAPQLALASSLVVYPGVTTQSEKSGTKDALKDADAALQYLQCVQKTITGGAYATVRKAFAFDAERSRRRPAGHRIPAGSQSPEAGGDVEKLLIPVATTQSLWSRGDDFWHVVGWAFNCSAAHKERWGRWSLWLDVTLDFLESDWEMCVQSARTRGDDALLESLIWQYVSSEPPANRGPRKRMLKAILATAEAYDLKQYPEIWEDEVEQDRKNDRSKRNKASPYVFNYEDAVMQEDSSQTSSVDDSKPDAVEQLGGLTAIHLRQRLIALLASISQQLPTYFTSPESFCDDYTSFLTALPVTRLHLYLSMSRLPLQLGLAFAVNLLHPLITTSLPNYFLIEPKQSDLEADLLPLKGATQGFVVAAKITVILERIFVHLFEGGMLIPTPTLRAAMEKGIQVRGMVYGSARIKHGNVEDEEEGKQVMEMAAGRMLGLLEVLEMARGAQGREDRLMETKGRGRAQPSKKSPVLLSSFGGSDLSSPPESGDLMSDV